MFGTYKTRTNEVTRRICADIDSALKQPSPAVAIERLLAARESTESGFSPLTIEAYRIKARASQYIVASMLGLALIGGPLFGPVALVASAVVGLAAAPIVSRLLPDPVPDHQALTTKIDAEVAKIAAEHPEDAVRSPLFAERLTAKFAAAAWKPDSPDENAYQKLAARAARELDRAGEQRAGPRS